MARKKKIDTTYPVVHAECARAIFNEGSGQIPHLAFTLTMRDGEVVQFEMQVAEAAKLIEQMMAAYNAIYPVLKTSRGGFGL